LSKFSGPCVIKDQDALDRFLKDEYNPAALKADAQFNTQIHNAEQLVQQTQKQLDEQTVSLGTLQVDEAKRRADLAIASEALKGYKGLIATHKNLHASLELIPKDDLLTYLEADDATCARVADWYQAAEEAGRNWGLNATNLRNNWEYFTTILGPTAQDIDASDFEFLINNRLGAISNELAFKDPNASLTRLHQDQDRVKKEVQRLTALKGDQERMLEGHRTAKKESLKQWDDPKTRLEQTYFLSSNTHELNSDEYALCALSLETCQLDFALSDVLSLQKKLEQVYEELEIKTIDEGLTYLKAMEKTIAETNVHFLVHKKREGEPLTVDGLWQATEDQLKKAQAKVAIRLEKQKKLQTLPEALKKQEEALSNELKAQEEKRAELLRVKARAMAINSQFTLLFENKEKNLKALKELTAIEQTFKEKYLALLEEGALEGMQKRTRKQRLMDIEAFRSKVEPVLVRHGKNDDPAVGDLVQKLKGWAHDLAQYYRALRIEHIDDYASLLLRRFPAQSEGARMRLLEQINHFEKNELPFIEGFLGAANPKLHDISSKILHIQQRKPSLTIPFVDEGAQLSFADQVNLLTKQFYGSTRGTGIFADYFKERAKTFWFGDLFSKSQQKARQKFVHEQLKSAIASYLSSDPHDKAPYNQLMSLLEKGRKKFHARAKVGQKNHEKSLQAKLAKLKGQIELIEERRCMEQARVDENENAFRVFR
jgi:hypothetical protein